MSVLFRGLRAANFISLFFYFAFLFFVPWAQAKGLCDPVLGEKCVSQASQVSTVLGNLMLLGFLVISLGVGWSLRARESKSRRGFGAE